MRAILYTGRAIIALDLCWLLFTFILYILLEIYNDKPAIFLSFLLSFFHFTAIVTMLYLTEKKHEDDPKSYELLNLDWKNAPLVVIPLFTDTVALTRTVRELSTAYPFFNAMVALHVFAFVVSVAAVIWFIVSVAVTRAARQRARTGRREFLLPTK
jgi:hypothetical protein